MKFALLTAFYCLLSLVGFTQDIKKYVIENTKHVSNIDTSSNEYGDLEAIGAAIGDARIVMLGEQDHGDAPTFLAKTRLIKYLHEKKGFNLLAFESDFYGLTKGWDELSKHPDSIRQFLRRNIFSFWIRSDACRYLFETYIPKSFQTKNPLYITGFDSQMYLDYSFNNLKNDLNKYFTDNNLVAKFANSNYQTFLEAVDGLTALDIHPQTFARINRKVLEEGLRIIKKVQVENKDSSYWSILFNNLISFANSSNEKRDRAMSDNLKFIANKKYKEEKIIVWAANTHIMKYTDHIKSNRKYFDRVIFKNMGTNFTKDPEVLAETYVMGFASYAGTAGRLWSIPYHIQTPDKNGLENWIAKDVAYGFVDFKGYNHKFDNPEKPFLMKAPMHDTSPSKVAKIPWNLVYDGIFFIRDMYSVQLAK